jgi:hypothetical protein
VVRQKEYGGVVVLGRVESSPTGLAWRVTFPDVEHAAASSYLRDLAASDCSPLTTRSYAFDLLRWSRFLHDRLIGWERAERVDVRAFVAHLRDTPNPQRLRRRADGPPPGSVNALTGKAELSTRYAARTINHQLSVLFGFYDHACAADRAAGQPGAGTAHPRWRTPERTPQPDARFRRPSARELPAEDTPPSLAGHPGACRDGSCASTRPSSAASTK